MKKDLASLGTSLSRDEAKKVVGAGSYWCQCSDGSATWTGTYPSLSEAARDSMNYCSTGASCGASLPPQ